MKPKKPIDPRPKCRTCKDRFVPFNNNMDQKHCMKKDECISAHTAKSISDREKKAKKENQLQKKIESVRDLNQRIKLYPKKYAARLKVGVQLLARMIDKKFGFDTCIDCGGKFGKQIDGGHFNSKGSNITLAYNLHNIHSQQSNCNQNGMGGGRRLEYYRGLIARYGQEYADYVDTGLQNEYKYIGLNEQDIYEKLQLVSEIIRNFDTYPLTGPLQARDFLNTKIGIYEKALYSSCETINNQSV